MSKPTPSSSASILIRSEGVVDTRTKNQEADVPPMFCMFKPCFSKALILAMTGVAAMIVICSVEHYRATMSTNLDSNNNKDNTAPFQYDFPVRDKTGLRPVDVNEYGETASSTLSSSMEMEGDDYDDDDMEQESGVKVGMIPSTFADEANAQEQERRSTLVRPTSSPTQLPFDLKFLNGIRYFQCRAKLKKKADVFLLHSDAFTLRIWRSSGVLRGLCNGHPHLTTTAVDLPAGITYDGLRDFLIAMSNRNLIDLPVTLVSPSASGWSMVTWMKNSPRTAFDYVKVWVPVAPGGLRQATDQEIINTLSPPNNPNRKIRTLAIYGDGDPSGKRISERLGKLVQAKVVQLPGNHSVYRQSPVLFARTITNFLGV